MMTPVNVHIKLLDPELPAPAYAKPGDAGADLRSRVDFELEPGERALVPAVGKGARCANKYPPIDS